MACDDASTTGSDDPCAAPRACSRRVAKVSGRAIAAARAQVAIGELLGRPVSPTVRRIAAAPSSPSPRIVEDLEGRRVIKVSGRAIAAARAQVAISETLGRPVSPTVRRIAAIP